MEIKVFKNKENFDPVTKMFIINSEVETEFFGFVIIEKFVEARNGRFYYKVKFKNSDNEYIVSNEVLEKGSLRDTELLKQWDLEKKPYPTFDYKQKEIDLSLKGKEFISKNKDKCKIINFVGNLQRSKLYKVKFLETEYEDVIYLHHLKSGSFSDISKNFLKIGDIYESKSYGKFEIIKFCEKIGGLFYYDIKFLETNYILFHVEKKEIQNGSVYDPYYPSYEKVGYLGKGKFNKTKDKIVFDTWQKIFIRCYNDKDSNYNAYGAKGVTVCEEWHNFQNFCEFFYKYKKDDWELDKDILCNINNIKPKYYSPETCIFLPPYLNGFLSNDKPNVGVYPFIDEDCNTKYESRIGNNYNILNLGIFDSFKEAKLAYAKEKYKIWVELLDTYKENLGDYLYNLCLQYDFGWKLDK